MERRCRNYPEIQRQQYLLTMLSSFTKNRGIDLRHLLDVIKLYKVVSTVQQCPQLNVSLLFIEQQVPIQCLSKDLWIRKRGLDSPAFKQFRIQWEIH